MRVTVKLTHRFTIPHLVPLIYLATQPTYCDLALLFLLIPHHAHSDATLTTSELDRVPLIKSPSFWVPKPVRCRTP